MSVNFNTAKCSTVIVVVGGLFVLMVTVDIFPTVFDKMNLIHVDSKYTMYVRNGIISMDYFRKFDFYCINNKLR